VAGKAMGSGRGAGGRERLGLHLRGGSVLPWGMASANPLPVLPVNPLIEAVRRAPLVRALTPEQRAELDRDLVDIAAGRTQLVAHDDVPAWLEARARSEG